MFTSALLLASAIAAQAVPAPSSVTPLVAPSIDEIRTTARVMLSSMCGTQCDVIDVKIKNKRVAPIGAVAPGFDDLPSSRTVPGEINLVLLFDSKLKPEYRKFVTERIKHRVGEFGLPVLITEDVKPFPPPPEIPKEPDPPQLAPPQQPMQPLIIQQQPAPLPPPLPPTDLGEAFILRLIEALPLLLAFGLLAWLVLRVLKRMEEMNQKKDGAHELDPSAEDAQSVLLTPEVIDETRAPIAATISLPPPSPDRLTADLRTHRGSTRRIFRRLLVRGEHDVVARAVALLGDFVVEDLSHDPPLRQALAAAGRRTAEILRAPMTDEESDELLRSVQAELVADRVAHRADDVRKEFEVLLGWGGETFATAMSRLERRLGLLLVRHAPAHLSESYLSGLSTETRAETVRKLLTEPSAEPEEIETLCEAIEAQTNASIVGGYEADHIVDLLDSLPADEQERVVGDLESTRPEFVRRNLGQLPVESALIRVPEHALQTAWAMVPFEDWITYLRVAPEAIRLRSIEACPARLRDGLKEELNLRVASDPHRATAARRKIVRAALNAAPRVHNGAASQLTVVEKSEVGPAPKPPSGAGQETKR